MEQNKSLRVTKQSNKLARDISERLGKMPPHSRETEEAILGAIILQAQVLNEVAGFLRPEHFYSEQHKEIYTAIQDMYAKGDPVDMRTVVQQLRRNGKLELIGGGFYIATLTDKVSSSENTEYHCRIIQEYYLKRELIQIASSLHHKAYEDTTDVFEMMDWLTRSQQEAMDKNMTGQQDKHIKEVAFKSLQNLQGRMSGHFTGVKSGYNSVDKLLNGHQAGDLVIVAARPGFGKTSYVFQMAVQIAESGIPVGVFSLEMPSVQLLDRAACSRAEVDSEKFKNGLLDEFDLKAVMDALGFLSMLPMFLDDAPMLNILEIRARARRWKLKNKVGIIIVDYLQLIKVVSSESKGMNRDQEIGMITRTLKAIAKELEIPVIAISALSRSVETRGGSKRPQLSDLRESGNIESDADVVEFLYRPEVYKITQDEDGQPTHGLCEIIIEKHRNGALGTAKLKFIARFTKFTDWYSEDSPPIDYAARQKSPVGPERSIERNLEMPF